MLDLEKAWKVSQKAALLGREVLLDYFGRITKVTEKLQAGLVSEADEEAEKVISQYLLKEFPDIAFVGEEETYKKQAQSPEEFSKYKSLERESFKKSGVWLVDPLDGTTNYVHGFPIFCVSIGLEYNGELQVGVIDIPILNKTYSAAKGRGAFVDGKPLHVSDRKNFSESLLATGFSAHDKSTLAEQLKIFGSLVSEVRGVRRAGSAAFDLCMVAEGIFEGYWEKGLQPWDTAAGALIVREAGGIVSTYDGEFFSPFANSIVASNKNINPALQQRIQSFRS